MSPSKSCDVQSEIVCLLFCGCAESQQQTHQRAVTETESDCLTARWWLAGLLRTSLFALRTLRQHGLPTKDLPKFLRKIVFKTVVGLSVLINHFLSNDFDWIQITFFVCNVVSHPPMRCRTGWLKDCIIIFYINYSLIAGRPTYRRPNALFHASQNEYF